jgi:WG containing repeat
MFSLLMAIMLALNAAPQDQKISWPVPFEVQGKYGYKDGRGSVVIAPEFQLARKFSAEGLAAVVDDKGWAYIDSRGRVVIRPFVFENGPDYFSQGLARFVMEGKFGFFNKQGHTVIKPAFDFAGPFQNGAAAVCSGCSLKSVGEHSRVVSGRWGFIDRTGRVIVPTDCEEVTKFENGRARVKRAGQWMYVDKQGKRVSP